MRYASLSCVLLLSGFTTVAAQTPRVYTRADSLRGSYTAPGRSWWDVSFYDLQVRINPADSSIRGSNGITYRVLQSARLMQIDAYLADPDGNEISFGGGPRE